MQKDVWQYGTPLHLYVVRARLQHDAPVERIHGYLSIGRAQPIVAARARTRARVHVPLPARQSPIDCA